MKNEEIPVLVDEVQTFGRTSELFASQHFNIINDVDIITIGKLSQACATLYRTSLTPSPGINGFFCALFWFSRVEKWNVIHMDIGWESFSIGSFISYLSQ